MHDLTSNGGSKESDRSWGLVIASAISLSFSSGAILLFTFGIFMKEVGGDLGWSRQVISLAMGAATVAIAIFLPFSGKLIDRFGPRLVALYGAMGFGLSFAALGLSGRSPVLFIALYALAGIFGAAHISLPYGRAIAGRFNHRLGLALGLAMAGIALGQALMPQLLGAFIAHVGWRGSYGLLGGLVIAISCPAIIFGMRGNFSHQPRGVSAPVELDGLTTREALTGSAHFWIIAGAVFLTAMALVGTVAHLTAFVTDKGYSSAFAANLMTALAISSLLGRIVVGHLMDRFHAAMVAFVIFLFPAIGLALMAGGVGGKTGLWFAAIAIGQGLGVESDLISYFVRRYFGFRSYGELGGYMLMIFAIGSSLGPFLMGANYDRIGAYDGMLAVFAVLFLVSALLIGRVGPYRYGPAQHLPH